MPTPFDQRDLIPNTPTAAALRGAVSRPATSIDAAEAPKKREIEIDPDSPNAPVCKPGRYVVIDPDDPNAPTCKPKRYIVAPEPEGLGASPLPTWARRLGDDLSETFNDRA